MPELKEIKEKVSRIPLLSQSATLLVDLMGKPDHSHAEVTKILECDAVLTAKVLKIANSTTYSPRQSITTIARAIAYMGDKVLVGIAIGTCAAPLYDKNMKGYDSERGELWAHSLMTAIASREIANFSKSGTNPDIAYTGGILHDIGKSVISEFMEGQTCDMVEKIDSKKTNGYLHAENEAIGTNHCLVGEELAYHWNLPKPFQVAILHHHTPKSSDPEYRSLAYVVHLGDIVAMMSGAGTGADAMMYHMDAEFTEYVDISSAELNSLMLDVIIEFENTKTMLEELRS